MNFDNLCVVFSYLDYKDLTNCRLVCKLFRDVADREEYWKTLYARHWDPSLREVNDKEREWHSAFINKYNDFGRYISVYIRTNNAWNTIKRTLCLYHDDATSFVLSGATEEDLDKYERENEISLPIDYRCSMRIHNGEMYRRNDTPDNQPPILGIVQYYHVTRSEYLLPLKWSSELSSQFPIFPLKTLRWGVIPLSMSKRNHLSPAFRTLQLLSVDDKKSGIPVGSIFYWVVKPHCDPVYHYHVADNVPPQMYINNAIEDTPMANHKMASSYIEWLEQLALKYQLNAEAAWGRIFDDNYSGYYFKPEWVLTTAHVTVRVGIRFIPEESAMNWFWTYRIIFEMAEDAPGSASCVLQRRHWVITDAHGRSDVVDGEGVIGEYPNMTPGTVWSYSSCTHLSTESGTMGGFFTFRNKKSEDTFRVTCPEFQLQRVPL